MNNLNDSFQVENYHDSLKSAIAGKRESEGKKP